MAVGWQRANNGLRNAGLRVLVFALLFTPAAVSAADDGSATSFIKTSETGFMAEGNPFFVTGVNNMAWELMNEGNARTEALRLAWTAEMSAYVKSLDPNHLVSSGHANVSEKLSDLTIPTLDFGTWHGYPLYYKLTVQQFNDMITEFCQLAARAKKPVLLEEFGYARSNLDSAEAYAMWLDTLTRDPNCAGWVVRRLVSRQDSGSYPVDEHDQFDVRNDGSAIWDVLKAAAARAAQTRQTSSASDTVRRLP